MTYRLRVLLLCLVATGSEAKDRLTLARADGASVPIIEYNDNGKGCPPLLIVSHGFGGTENALSWLARAASKAGFRAITMGHRESGRAQARAVSRSPDRWAALSAELRDPLVNAARMRDLDAVWTYANRRCRPPFAALAGHSFGAQLTIIEAGARNTVGATGQDRFDAYIALSPQGEGVRFPKGAWRGITKPVLMVTGTRDRTIGGGWEHRLTAFTGLAPGHKWLAVIDGANHMGVGGRGGKNHQRDVTAIVLAFLAHMGKPSPSDMPQRNGVRYRMK